MSELLLLTTTCIAIFSAYKIGHYQGMDETLEMLSNKFTLMYFPEDETAFKKDVLGEDNE